MKLHNFLRRESANLICWFRILASIALALAKQPGLGWAILCATAFISDTVDGWFYRRLAPEERPCHWFNRLPLSMDPLADFIFVAGCFAYTESAPASAVGIAVLAIIAILWNIVGYCSSDIVYAIAMTLFTYFWFGLMLGGMCKIWFYSVAMPFCLLGIGVTLTVFYIIHFKTRVKSRTIRTRG